MADVGVKQQEPHEDQGVDNDRTDTKAEERDDGRQTKTAETEEPLATEQKEEPPATKQREDPPATKQREEPPATKQREEPPATKQREEPPASRDEERRGDTRDNQSVSSGRVSAYVNGTSVKGARMKTNKSNIKSSIQKDIVEHGHSRGKKCPRDSDSISSFSFSSQPSLKQRKSTNVGDITPDNKYTNHSRIVKTHEDNNPKILNKSCKNDSQSNSVHKGGSDTKKQPNDVTSTDNTSFVSGVVNSEKSKSSDASKILFALGINACVTDISPDPITPDQDASGSACVENVVEEDSFYDGDLRGEELEDGGVDLAHSNIPVNDHTIDFFTQPAKIPSGKTSQNFYQEPPLMTSLKTTSNKEIFQRPLTNESEADVISNSTMTMTSVQEELETKSDEGDDVTRGDLAPESPRTLQLEDDNRAMEKFEESAKTMAHPGVGSREISKNWPLTVERQSYKFTSNALISSENQIIHPAQENENMNNFQDFRADEIKRNSRHPHFFHRDSVSQGSEIPEKVEEAQDSMTPFGARPNCNDTNDQEDVYSCESFEALSPALDQSVNSNLGTSRIGRSVSQLSLNHEDSLTPVGNDDKNPGTQIVAVLAARKLKAEQAKGDKDGKSFISDNKRQQASHHGDATLPSCENRKEDKDDFYQSLNFDFHQAQTDFDLRVDVKTEAFFHGKTSPTGNSEIAPNNNSVDSHYKRPAGTKSSVVTGNRLETVKSSPWLMDANFQQNTRGRKTPEIKKELVRKKNPPPDNSPPIEMPKFTELFPQQPEEGTSGHEVVPKVVALAPGREGKTLERTSNANRDIPHHEMNNSGDNDTIYNNRENNDVESIVDDFDEFDSTHLAMFRNRNETEKMFESSDRKTFDSVDQQTLSRQAEGGKPLSPSDTNQGQHVDTLKGQGRRTLHASRPISRSATDLTSSVVESGGFGRKPRPNTTQTMARRGESEMTKGQSQKQSEGTKNSQENNTKAAEENTTKGTGKTNKTGNSPSRRDNDNHNQKNTKSVNKGGDSTKEGTKTSPKSQKSSPKKDTAKKDKKGSPDRKAEGGVKGSDTKKGGTKGENAEQEKNEKEATDKNSANDTSQSSHTELSEGRTKQKEFFKLELQRLESSLKRESSKISAPSKKPHTPYIFNTLEPYYNTQITRYLIELPDEIKHGHTSRRTAQGLTDPWVDLKMDRDILPKVPSKPVSRQVAILKREKEIRDRKKRSAMSQASSGRKEGSTRLPKFPVVHLETQDLASRQLFYSDVPYLRSELKSKYSSSARSKIDEDYKRTQQDFFRMELDKLDEVHPVNRRNMRSAYFAYLQNTPGSKKAITECVRSLESGKAQ